MTWCVKRYFGGWKLLDEKGVVEASIRKNPRNRSFSICGSTSGRCLDAVRQEKGSICYLLHEDADTVACARPVFDPAPLVWPPRICRLLLDTRYGTMVMERGNPGVRVLVNGQEVGRMSAFFSLLPVSIEHNGQFSALFWGGLFALAEYMFHEDDYLVV